MINYIGQQMFTISGMPTSFPHKQVIIEKGYIVKIKDINRFTEYVIDGIVFNPRQFHRLLSGVIVEHDEKILMHHIYRDAIRNNDRALVRILHTWVSLANLTFVHAKSSEWTKSGLKGLYE